MPVLPAHSRLTKAVDFGRAMRGGKRCSSRTLVVHLGTVETPIEDGRPRVGFIVSKAVGGSVVRNRVKRRLRHVMAPRLDCLRGDALVVVRALPAAAAATSVELDGDLDRCLRELL